jgi:hypothetical protein
MLNHEAWAEWDEKDPQVPKGSIPCRVKKGDSNTCFISTSLYCTPRSLNKNIYFVKIV